MCAHVCQGCACAGKCARTFGTRIQGKPIREGVKLLFSGFAALHSWDYQRGTLRPQEGTRALPAFPEKGGRLHQKGVESHLWPLAADNKMSQAGGLKEPLPGQLQAVPSAPPPPLPALISVG